MMYFALCSDGRIYSLDTCKDWEEADEKVEQKKLETIWIFDEIDARDWIAFLSKVIAEDNE